MRKEVTKTIPYRLQFIDSAKFVENSLSNLVDNLADGIHNFTCKNEHDTKKCTACGTKYKDFQ